MAGFFKAPEAFSNLADSGLKRLVSRTIDLREITILKLLQLIIRQESACFYCKEKFEESCKFGRTFLIV